MTQVAASVAIVLHAKGKMEEVMKRGLFNPGLKCIIHGIGTLAYQDSWDLFDQIMITYPWLNKDQNGFFLFKAADFQPRFHGRECWKV